MEGALARFEVHATGIFLVIILLIARVYILIPVHVLQHSPFGIEKGRGNKHSFFSLSLRVLFLAPTHGQRFLTLHPISFHKIALREARANDLQDPTDCILWCGDGSSDFPAALESDIVLARQGTSLEKLCKANQIEHLAFTSFSTVQEKVEEWLANSTEQ